MTLIQSVKLNGDDPYAYLKDVLTRLLPTQKNNAIGELLPHNWKQAMPNKANSEAKKVVSRRRHANNS